MSEVVELVLGVYYHVTLQRCAARGGSDAQCVQFKDVLGAVHWLCAPKELHVRGDDLLGHFAVDGLVDVGGVTLVSVAHSRERLSLYGLEDGEEWVLFLCLGEGLLVGLFAVGSLLGRSDVVLCALQLKLRSCLLLCFGDSGILLLGSGCYVLLCGISLCGVGSCVLLARGDVGELRIELLEVWEHLLCVVCLPELKVCRTLEELAYTLWLTYARHLHHQTAFLALEALDVRLYHAELVDTVAHYVVRVVDGVAHLGAEGSLHL